MKLDKINLDKNDLILKELYVSKNNLEQKSNLVEKFILKKLYYEKLYFYKKILKIDKKFLYLNRDYKVCNEIINNEKLRIEFKNKLIKYENCLILIIKNNCSNIQSLEKFIRSFYKKELIYFYNDIEASISLSNKMNDLSEYIKDDTRPFNENSRQLFIKKIMILINSQNSINYTYIDSQISSLERDFRKKYNEYIADSDKNNFSINSKINQVDEMLLEKKLASDIRVKLESLKNQLLRISKDNSDCFDVRIKLNNFNIEFNNVKLKIDSVSLYSRTFKFILNRSERIMKELSFFADRYDIERKRTNLNSFPQILSFEQYKKNMKKFIVISKSLLLND